MLSAQQLNDLSQCDIDLCVDRSQDDDAIRLDPLRAPIASLPISRSPARLTPGAHPAHRTCRGYPKPLGR